MHSSIRIRTPEILKLSAATSIHGGSIAIIAIILLSFFGVPAYSWAADSAAPDPQNGTSLAQLSLQQLGDVAVTTASKEPEELRDTPAAVYVLTAEDIRRAGVTNIPDALRLVPGVQVSRVDSNTWAIAIRGFDTVVSRDVLVLIDGRSVYSPLFAGVYWDVQNVPMEDIDRIEVIRGPGGTIWGANAVNGVINIITKNAGQTQGSLVAVGGGNVDQGTGTFQYGGELGHKVDYRFYGMAFGRGPEDDPGGDYFDPWQMGQTGFRMDWKKGESDEFTFQGDMYDGREGQIINLSYISPPSSVTVQGTQVVGGGNVLWRWKRRLKNGSDFQLQTYYDNTYRMGPQFGDRRSTVDVDFTDHIPVASRLDLIWGLGSRWSPDDFLQNVPTVDFTPNDQDDYVYSAFVQGEIHIVPHRFSVTLGSKFEYNNFSGFEYEPSARVLWTPGTRNTFWGAVTRAVRTPSEIDQDLEETTVAVPPAEPLPVFLEFKGNPNFVAEVMIGYEAGYRTTLSQKLYLDIAGFHNDYNNLVSYSAANATVHYITDPPPLDLDIVVPYGNGLYGSTDGVEIAPDWKVTSWWQVKGSYSYLYLRVQNKPGQTDVNSLNILNDNGSSPRDMVTAQSLVDLPHHLQLDTTLRYMSQLPKQGVAAYTTADARFGWRCRPDLDLSVVGQNLLQPEHAEFSGGSPAGLVEIKRSVYAKITWTHER